MEDQAVYIAFRQHYETTHQASIPQLVVPSRDDYKVKLQYRVWLRWAVFVMFAAAAALSGVHTIPTVYNGIQVGVIITEDIRRIASALSFLAVELSIFISAYMMNKNKGLAIAILVVGFLVAMAANISSVFNAMNAVDSGGKIVAVILGVGAPLIALMAGAMFVEIDNEEKRAADETEQRYQTAVKQATKDYQKAMRQFDADVLSAFQKYMQQAQRRTRPQVSVEVSADRPRGQLGGQIDGQKILSANASAGEKKDKRTLISEYFGLHPDALRMSDRTLEPIISEAIGVDVKRTIINEVRTSLLRQSTDTSNDKLDGQ